MEPTLSQKLRNSLIQLVAGIILVGLASWYLNNHPAEWQSIQSSVSTARQKVSQWLSFGGGSSSVTTQAQQSQAIGQLEEIITAIQSCSPSTEVAEYQSLYDAMSQASSAEFARNTVNYYNQMGVAYQNMQELCNNAPQALDG